MNGQEVIATTGILPAKMHIHKWPKSERPREKLLERGAHALSDAELLAVLLRCGTRGRNAIELAQEHILAFGSLRELLTAEWPQWERRKDAGGVGGVGIARYAALQAGLELARRHLLEPLKVTSALTAPAATWGGPRRVRVPRTESAFGPTFPAFSSKSSVYGTCGVQGASAINDSRTDSPRNGTLGTEIALLTPYSGSKLASFGVWKCEFGCALVVN